MARSELSRKRKGNAIQPTQQRRSEIRKWMGGGGGRKKKLEIQFPPPPPLLSNKRRLLSFFFFVRRRQHRSVPGVRIMEYREQAKNILDRCYLKWRRQQKLHGAVGKGRSADKKMKCPNPTG